MTQLTVGQILALEHYLLGFDYEKKFIQTLEDFMSRSDEDISLNEIYEDIERDVLAKQIETLSKLIDENITKV